MKATKATAQPGDFDTLLAQLSKSYDKEIARIDREIDHAHHKIHELLAASADTTEQFESIAKVRQREAEELMAQGKKKEAARKRQEAQDAEAAPRRLESECRITPCKQPRSKTTGGTRPARYWTNWCPVSCSS